MEGFTDADRERAIEHRQEIHDMSVRLSAVERGQRVSLRRIRRLPDLTATAIVRAVGWRAMVLIGAGIVLGSVLGGTGVELVRALASKWITTMVGH